jgi:alpha-tubulin suppressor-like RCC1 family protein
MSDGSVRCWGQNSEGQIGSGSVGPFAVADATRVVGLGGVREVDAGLQTTCAVANDLNAYCWGSDSFGLLGDGAVGLPSATGTPQQVPGISEVRAIGVGERHACAVNTGGQVLCWGDDQNGQLGDGTVGSPSVRPAPAPVLGVTGAVDVVAGPDHSCALIDDGSVQCWGNDNGGVLGDGVVGSPNIRAVAADVVGLSGARAISAGSDSTCVVLVSGGGACWGADSVGQLGDGSPNNTFQPSPASVVGASGLAAVGAGHYFNCAAASSGAAVCWGRDFYGELGDGAVAAPSTNPAPVGVVGLSDAKSIDGGAGHACAVRATGRVVCWGSDNAGQLGDGQPATPSDNPTPVVVKGI